VLNHARCTVVGKVKAIDTIYQGENWVDVGGSISLACKIPMEDPFALEWSLNNETLDLSPVNFL